MEKKTIGAFIAALRKANGLTQRELAEKLNVSDKAVISLVAAAATMLYCILNTANATKK